MSETTYTYRRKRGLCVRCGAKAENGRSMCREHLNAANAAVCVRIARQTESGLCRYPGCKCAPVTNRVLCEVHGAASRERSNARNEENRPARAKAQRERIRAHVAAGLCRYCDEPPVPNRTVCVRHLAEQNDRAKRKREDKAERGECIKFGCSRPRASGHQYCATCKRANAAYHRRYRARKKKRK